MERDLRALRRSRLMNHSEFRTMTTALEKYHKDVKVAMMIRKRSTTADKKEMDMRPYLYDEGDSYETPFYTTLLKMLYEVATSTFYEKQHEDMVKVFNWYMANKKLITSPPVVDIPPPKSPTPDPEKKDPIIAEQEATEADEGKEPVKYHEVPKIHFRPRTAPPIENRRGTRYVTWNEAQERGPKRPSSGQKGQRFGYQQRAAYVKEQLARSLQIKKFGPQTDVPYVPDKNFYNKYLNRPGTAPPPNRHLQVRMKGTEGLKSFVLKPFSTPAPTPSPMNSPLTSPRDSPISVSRARSPQLTANFTPERVKEPSVKLNVRLPQETDKPKENGHHPTTNGNDTPSIESDMEFDEESMDIPDDLPTKLPSQEPLPKNGTTSEIERILEKQRQEELLLEEQHNLLQKRLLHEYDRYARDCTKKDKERAACVEMADGELALNVNGSSRVVHPAPVGTYDLSSPQIIPSYNRVFSRQQDTLSRNTPDGSMVQSGYSPARHLKHAGMPPFTRPDDLIHVDAVLGMVTPIGLQMEYDRGRTSAGYTYTGLKQPMTPVPHQTPSNTPSESIPRMSSASSTASQDTDSPRSTTSEHKSLDLKGKEPELTPERTDRDYNVHFHQNKSPQDTQAKHYKVSGPVSPDTIRYQWTDDGFGSMTYMKRLKSPVSPRTPRKTPNASQSAKQSSEPVTMATGSRSINKRQLASLMVVRQLGESDRRNSDRFGGPSSGKPSSAPDIPADYNYQLEYMNICQPVGPRLGETERPSTVAWYLQGDHGLYRDPVSPRYDSDGIRLKRDVRIPQDRSLMVEGKHIGGESDGHTTPPEGSPTKSEDATTTVAPPTSKDDTTTLDNRSDEEKPADSLPVTSTASRSPPRGSLRPTSPKPPRPHSPTSHRHISIPTGKRAGAPSSRPCSRPCSARSEKSEKTYNFSVKQFNHFCWPDEALLDDDYLRQREAWAAVNIQRIFRGFMARQYYLSLKTAESDRQRRAALTLQSHMRGFLARKKMEFKMKDYKPSTRTKEWARQYKDELKQREAARAQKKQYILLQMNKQGEKQGEQLKGVTAHQNIFDIYHPTPEGPTKAQMKAAAITIQRYFRGWFVRRMYQKVKTKALKRTLSFNKFIKGYQSLLYRIQKRYGVGDPLTSLQFNELMEYVERLNKYEIAFEKFAKDGVLSYNDIKEYFKACGHVPSQKEIDEAIEIVTKMSAKGRNLTKAEAVEVLFQIYVPKGTGLKLQDVRKSTWLNPLSEGQDIMQLLSKKDLEMTNLGKCLAVVANAGKENEEIQDLLRPASARSDKKSKKGDKSSKTRQTTLAQYPTRPSRPSSSSSSRSRSPKPGKAKR